MRTDWEQFTNDFFLVSLRRSYKHQKLDALFGKLFLTFLSVYLFYSKFSKHQNFDALFGKLFLTFL